MQFVGCVDDEGLGKMLIIYNFVFSITVIK